MVRLGCINDAFQVAEIFEDGKVRLNDVYHGEYMTQYSFSEYTNSNLHNMKK